MKLDRRTCLRGLGVSLPLPFLNMMEGAQSQDKPPVRFVALFKPNGIHTPSWNVSGGTYQDYHMSPLMQPFSKHKEDLIVLDNMGDFGFSSHQNSTRRFLSGHHQNTKSASIDQLIADKIGQNTSQKSLELTTEGLFPNQINCSYISYDQQGKALSRSSDPQMVFDKLFRNDMSHPRKRKSMSSLLDRVREDAKRLQRRVGYEDHHTLDQYFSVLRDTEKRIHRASLRKAPKIAFDELERPHASQGFDDMVESMLDIIVMALWTDQTRVASYMLGNDNSRMVFDFLGVHEQHHYLSHFFRNFTRSNLEHLLKISEWHMQKFDSLLTKMKAYKDQNGTLLDNSLVLFGSGMGHSDNHTAQRIPTVIAGKAGGRLKAGHYIRYAENQPLSRLHLAILNEFGVEKENYATEAQALSGLKGEAFVEFKEREFASWLNNKGKTIDAQGRLRQSSSLDEGNIFYLDIQGKPSLKLQLKFRDFHDFNLPYHNGTPVQITGEGQNQNGQWVMSKINSLKSVFGKKPGQQGG